MRNRVIYYNPALKKLARDLRKQNILAEVLLWQQIKNKALGVQFHRQVPLLEYIVDFYCHEISLAIEVDGSTHDFDVGQERDLRRQPLLEQQGVHFIRFPDKAVIYDIQNVLVALEEEINRHKGASVSTMETSP